MELKKITQQVEGIMLKNRKQTNGHQYTIPSPDTYPYQWLWDSCFHAIILSHINLADAKEELLSLVMAQFENGMLPHMIYWERQEGPQFDHVNLLEWGREGMSTITQPPMLAYAAWRIFSQDQDLIFLHKLYRSLFHFYQYLLHQRDPHARHLVGIVNPDESGEDNSPRFDMLLDLPPRHKLEENYNRRKNLMVENQKCDFDAPFCMKNFFWVKDVPFNAILIENLRCLARIAEKVGRPYDAGYFLEKAEFIGKAMRRHMFEDGVFWSTYGDHFTKIKVKTWAMFAPLFSGTYTPAEVAVLVEEHLENEQEFATEFLLPTVSLDEPSFQAKGDLWRGPVWFAPNWFVFHGLRNFGFEKQAQRILDSTVGLLEKSGFREYYDPHTGEGLGARDFTWGGLVLDMLEGGKSK